MKTFPSDRFVRLRLPSPDEHHVTATLVQRPAGADSRTLPHPLLDQLIQDDPSRGTLIAAQLAELARHENALFAWLELDSENVKLYLDDPIAALRQALPNLADDFFQAWELS
ncbi:hypothetical protein [Burkholderia alba]|uniref:hypothetical protein n=1 Tax=Burkholderia alba TaxID=2683677 RepID=UPI002B053DFF|nr:hypothetical protein [Burkholderia alba]